MSKRYKLPESRIPQRRKPIECQFPKCKKEATHSLGMADPDAEKNYYCEKHCKEVKMNTIMSLYRKTGQGELK